MQVGQKYEIKITIQDDEYMPKMKYVLATLLKEYSHFYLFQTKHYKTAINKCNANLIKEV